MSDKYAEEIENVVEDTDLDVDKMFKKLGNIQDKIKYTAFGKTKINKSVKGSAMSESHCFGKYEANEILKKQSEKIEEEVEQIRCMKQGWCSPVFQMKEVIAGPRKAGQEAASVKDPKTGKMVVSPTEI